MTKYILYFIGAYLVGSIPTGYIAARLKCKASIFEPGNRQAMRIGDVFKILGTPLGLFVTLLDLLKGTFAVWPLITLVIGYEGHGDWRIVSLGALLVVIGHCNSAFLGFRGGRGLATTFGVLFPLLPGPAFISCLIWAGLAFWGLSTRPGALSAAGAMPILSVLWIWFFQTERLDYLYVVAFLSIWTLWEQRQSLQSYIGLSQIAKATAAEAKLTEEKAENDKNRQNGEIGDGHGK